MLSEQWLSNKAQQSVLIWHCWRTSQNKENNMFLSQTHVTGKNEAPSLLGRLKLPRPRPHLVIIDGSAITISQRRGNARRRGRKSERGNMMQWGNKEENPRTQDACEPERGVKRDKWDMNGCRWDAKKHDIREGNATERRRDEGIKAWVMLNLFLSSIYSI